MSSTNRNERTSAPILMPTRYDRVASLLISMLVLSGASVAVLFVIWVGATSDKPIDQPKIGRGQLTGQSHDVLTDELETPELAELSSRFDEMAVAMSTVLNAEAVNSVIDIDTKLPASREIGGKDLRPIGDLALEQVPQWERWEIRYTAANIEGYAKQLDFFGIELGAAGGGKKKVDYASKLSAKSPATRSAPGDEETRFYVTWRGGRLALMDRKLLLKAGIEVEGRIVLQFYPQKVEDSLAIMESKHRKDGRIDKIQKTIFGVRPSKEGYEFYIIEQS